MTTITIIDGITGEQITRDMNTAELAQWETDQAQRVKAAEAKAKAEESRDRKRQEVLDRLGITAEELKTILT